MGVQRKKFPYTIHKCPPYNADIAADAKSKFKEGKT